MQNFDAFGVSMIQHVDKGLATGWAEAEAMFRALGGIPPVDKKLAQFLLNDRKVLRFKVQLWENY